MSDIPQTAEEAVRLIGAVIAHLPDEEQKRLAFFFSLNDAEDTAEKVIAYFADMLSTLSSDQLGELDAVIKLERQERRVFVHPLANDTDCGVIPNEDGSDALVFLAPGMWKDFLKNMDDIQKQRTKDWTFLNNIINRFAEQSKDVADRRRKLERCREVRKEAKVKRKEEIDALFVEGYNRSEIYEQMRLKHEPLMKGRGQDYMSEDSMWASYTVAGGCHPKALRPRGRPKKNGGNCNNGN